MLRPSNFALVLSVPMVLILSPKPVRAELECTQPVVDKGEVKSGQPFSHRFTIANRGPGVVEITDVRPSCGCLGPKLDKRGLQVGRVRASYCSKSTP